MRLRLPGDRRSRLVAIVAALLVAALGAGWLWLRSIDAERARLADLDRVVVESERCVPPNATGVTLWLPAEPAVDVEPFAGNVYAATPGGLEVYDAQGTLVRRYTSLDGLPENDVTCLERFGGKLYVGTAHAGLLEFDGTGFTRYRFVRPEATHVSALRAAEGELLVGTFDAGLFEFDGAQFTRRYGRDLGDACRQVTAIDEHASRLYVGTFDAGLFVWQEGRAANLRTTDGMPSNRVTGLAFRAGTPLVATDLGVVEIGPAGAPSAIDRTPNATGLAVRGDQTWIASLTRGVAPTGGDGAGGPLRPVASRSVPNPASSLGVGLPSSGSLGLKVEDGVLWALMEDGIYTSVASEGPVRFEVYARPDATSGVSAGHVAALAIDGRGRVWAGTFDSGLDVLDPETGNREDRVEDASVREVNAIVSDAGADRIWVAASGGIVQFDGGRRSKSFSQNEGLAGSSATAIASRVGGSETGLAVATNAGLTVLDGPTARTLTAFHGLPNNHAYAVAVAGGRLFVGTLGGLAEVETMRIGRTFTVSNSRLTHNWVNALAGFEGRLFIGTYGGGVSVLEPGGEIDVFDETAGTDVNPGAMAVIGRRLFVGTLSDGALSLDLDTGRWTRLGAVLGTANVTSFAANERYIFIGTDNGIVRVERSALS